MNDQPKTFEPFTITSFDVKFYDGLFNTPALELAIRGWCDCVERGLGDGTLSVSWDQKAYVVSGPANLSAPGRDMMPIGVITFDHLPGFKKVWISQSWVQPEYRGLGVYRMMWERVILKAAELKAVKIESGTHMNNTTMRSIARKLGRSETGITLTYDVPQELIDAVAAPK